MAQISPLVPSPNLRNLWMSAPAPFPPVSCLHAYICPTPNVVTPFHPFRVFVARLRHFLLAILASLAVISSAFRVLETLCVSVSLWLNPGLRSPDGSRTIQRTG